MCQFPSPRIFWNWRNETGNNFFLKLSEKNKPRRDIFDCLMEKIPREYRKFMLKKGNKKKRVMCQSIWMLCCKSRKVNKFSSWLNGICWVFGGSNTPWHPPARTRKPTKKKCIQWKTAHTQITQRQRVNISIHKIRLICVWCIKNSKNPYPSTNGFFLLLSFNLKVKELKNKLLSELIIHWQWKRYPMKNDK